MANNNIVVDRFLDPNSSNLLPVDASYVDYKYEKVTSSTAPGDWGEGKRAEFVFPEYENSVWDTSEGLYIDCVANLQLIANTPGGTYQGDRTANNLSSVATAAIEQFFTSGLIDDIDVSVGGVALKNFDAPANLYPTLQAVYIATNDMQSPASKGGNAMIRNIVYGVEPADDPDKIGEAIKDDSSPPFPLKNRDIFNDTKNPFHMSLDKGGPQVYLDAINIIDYQTDINKELHFSGFGSSYTYRQINTTSDEALALAGTNEPNPHPLRFIMKIPDGYLDNFWKKPANIKHRIAITRSRSLLYSICGRALADKYSSNFVATGGDATATYRLNFSRMDMYVKRLTLSEAQLSLYRSLPLLEYDVQRWSCQAFNLTSTSFNQLTNWTKTPEAIFIGIQLNYNLSPPPVPVGEDFGKSNSVYRSPSLNQIRFTSLYLNTTYGQIPNERLIFERNGLEDPNQTSVRAYEHFIKACAGYPNNVIDYQTWNSNFRWYGFVLNSSEANPNTEVPLPSRSNVNVVAQLEVNGTITDYSIVCVAMYHGKLGCANMRSIFMTI